MKKENPWRARLFLTVLIVAGAIMLPTSLLLIVGMLPTIIMYFFDRSPEKARVITVGAMNLAGCMPFVLEIWHRGHTVDMALNYLTQPRTIVVMYFAAAIGYMIEWIVSGVFASIMMQRAKSRIAELEKNRLKLEERWGIEVNGQHVLDDEGFMIDTNNPLG